MSAERVVIDRAIAYATERAASAAARAQKSVETYSYDTGRERAYEDVAQLLRLGLSTADAVAAERDAS